MTQANIKNFRVSLGAVNKIIKQKAETGNVGVRKIGKCGRKRKTSKRDNSFIIRESKCNPRKTGDELKRDLEQIGVNVSSSTICRRLIENGRFAKKLIKKQLLTSAMKKKRLEWAIKHKEWTVEVWSKVVFCNESHFYVQGHMCQQFQLNVNLES